MVTKLFLGLVSFVYIGLAIWCSVSPGVTSQKVGFELKGGSGRSEFLTVYGGLEFAVGLILLISILKSETVYYGLLACVVIHGSLVLFRSISFVLYRDIGSMTYQLAIGEWVIFLIGCALLWFGRNQR